MKRVRVSGVLLVAALVILSGCSGFQLASQKKNVIVEKISPNTFTVNFWGNAYMSQKATLPQIFRSL